MSSNLSLDFPEFSLRVNSSTKVESYEFEDFRLDAGTLMLYHLGTEVPLQPKAAATLLALIRRHGEIVSKNELLAAVWPDTVVEESNLFLYLSLLRKTLGLQRSGKPWVETFRGRGYRFSGEVTLAEHDRTKNETSISRPSGQVVNLSDWIEKGAAHEAEGSSPTEDREPEPDRRISSKRFAVGLVFTLLGVGLVGFFLLNRSAQREVGTETGRDISVTALTTGNDVHGPIISRDGRYFVYRSLEGDIQRLMLQAVGAPTPLEILSTQTLRIYAKRFSPDGAFIYFTAHEKSESPLSLYRISASGGAPKKILSGVGGDSSISFSPDGTEFVFARTKTDAQFNSITIARTDGTSQRDILASQTDFFSYPEWSPDGKSIAYARFDSQNRLLETVNVDSREISSVLDEPLDSCYQIAWTHDGSALVFNGTKFGEAMTTRRDQVWLVRLSNRKLIRLTPEGSRYTFGGLSDDGAAIVGTVDRVSQIWSMDSDGDSRTAIQLTNGKADGRSGLATLPDGRIGYLARNGDNWEIWLMNSDGSGAFRLFNELPAIDELRATHDGKYFLFNAPVDRRYNLFRLNVDGTDLRQLTFETARWVGDPAPSSDSRWVICSIQPIDTSQASTVYRIPIDGGDLIPVTGIGDGLQVAHYSPDGSLIAYVDQAEVPAKLRVVGADGVPAVRLFDVETDALLNVGAIWTPDGRSLAYIVYRNKVSNIWLQPIDGGPRRQLTDFTSGHIYRIAYSADGKRIYLARGHAKNDALLITNY